MTKLVGSKAGTKAEVARSTLDKAPPPLLPSFLFLSPPGLIPHLPALCVEAVSQMTSFGGCHLEGILKVVTRTEGRGLGNNCHHCHRHH